MMDDKPVCLNLCRVCLAENANFQSIFSKDESSEGNLHLSEMIMTYASVEIVQGDGLPDIVCIECAEKAVAAYHFKQRCEESDIRLRHYWKSYRDSYPVDERIDLSTLGINPENLDIVVKSEESVKNEERRDENHVSDSFDEHSDEFDLQQEGVVWVPQKFGCIHCEQTFENETQLAEHSCSCIEESEQSDQEIENMSKPYISAESDDIMMGRIIEIKSEEYDETSSKTNELNKKHCPHCGKTFKKPSHLTRHMKIHAYLKPHVCSLCNRGFVRSEQLINHMNAHSGIKPHVCKTCGKGFNQISNLKDHLRTHNGERPFLCSICGRGFNQLGNLRQHTIRHSGIKSHLCSTCGSGFASKGELCAHLRKHTGVRPFVCPVCNHGFTTSSSLTKHKRIHSGEKPYECEVCEMRFSRSGILARHRRTHTGEKPYVCNYCAKAFSQSNDLSSHLRIHTGEKPYICDVCGHSFRQSSALRTHKKIHNSKSPIMAMPVILDIFTPNRIELLSSKKKVDMSETNRIEFVSTSTTQPILEKLLSTRPIDVPSPVRIDFIDTSSNQIDSSTDTKLIEPGTHVDILTPTSTINASSSTTNETNRIEPCM